MTSTPPPSRPVADTPLTRWWLSGMVAYVALLPSIYMMFSAENRFSLRWTSTNHYGILLAVFLYATVVWLGWETVRKIVSNFPRIRTLASMGGGVLLWVVTCRTAVSIYVKSQTGDFSYEPEVENALLNWVQTGAAKIIYYLVVPSLLWVWLRGAFAGTFLKVYKLFSILLVFLIVIPLSYPTYDSSEVVIETDLSTVEQGADRATDVFIFLLDEWSWDRTFPEGQVWDEMPFLKEWVKGVTVYSDCYSPEFQTTAAIPMFLFQNDQEFSALDFDGVRDFVLSHQPHEGESLFKALGSNRFTVAAGFWHDYRNLIKGHADLIFSRSGSTTGSQLNTWGECKKILSRQLFFLRWFGIKSTPLSVDFVKNVMEYNLEAVHEQTLRVLNEVKAPMFGYFHYCIPHFPYVYNREGRRTDITAESIHEETIPNYLDNLRYTDVILEEIISELKKTERYEDALIVVTSDHSWRHDPEYEDIVIDEFNHRDRKKSVMKHVPLIIKEPGQQEGAVISDEMYLQELLPLLQNKLGES